MSISLASKLAVLEKWHTLHAAQCARYDLACARQCAACCTRNVTLTTLEGLMLLRHLESDHLPDWRERLAAAGVPGRFQPRLTINALADRCAKDLDIPEETLDPQSGPCPLLAKAPTADLCPVYLVRPFGCRAMVSQTTCTHGGAAQMPDFILTLNNVLLQYIEGLDVPGFSGNLIDVLLFLDNAGNRRRYEQQLDLKPPESLLTNRPIPVLMIPPEHRRKMQPVLQAIHAQMQQALLQSGGESKEAS